MMRLFFLCVLLGVLAAPSEVHAARRKAAAPPVREPKPVKFSTVVIDPGHGGTDPGGIPGQKVKEKQMALDVALRLRKKLNRMGYETVITRVSDRDVAKDTRVAVAASRPRAVFVSIHFNSANRAGAKGFETYFNTGNSRVMAMHIHGQLLSIKSAVNRGVKRAGFFVLRRNSLRAVLVECGFLTNPDEAALARKASYRDKIAQSIATGIHTYHASL